MQVFHTSPVKIEKINKYGTFGECLFFSSDVYQMSKASVNVYSIELDDVISASQLYHEDSIAEIAERFNVDVETAEGLLDGSESVFELGFDGEDDWWLQGVRGQCANLMGYDACEDEDEQGAVYIVPMFGKEHLLKEASYQKTI